MDALLKQLTERVSAERLRDLTLSLVRIPSPTGDSGKVTQHYADLVRSLGLSVEVFRDFPQSPSTIARYGQTVDGPTLTLDGHLDTIHAAHPTPTCDGQRIFGRGAGDMKSGIAAMVEATRVLAESGVRLGGNLILATHSLHEAPVGHMEGLKALIARGDVFVDAALVAEGGFNTVAIRGKGQALYDITVTRKGEVLHENEARPRNIPNPLDYAVHLAARILARDQELSRQSDALLGPETYFIGQVHGGDLYNRVPTRAYINGVYRCWPDKDWPDIRREFSELLGSVERHPEISVDLRLGGNGLGFEVPADARIVSTLRAAYRDVVGPDLPLVGELSVCDVNVIVREAGIPAVAHGTGSTTAHADLESVLIADVVRTTKIYLAMIVNYLGVRE
jgi:succinyl-diaminopimelate desuccinylase